MVQFNTRANEILLKLVYYGPGLSGKTTNLQALHAMCASENRGELFSVNTQEDRTLFFDLLPINLGYIYGNAIHLQVYTVPGQVQYDASRRVVLSGADGVVFVADSSEAKMQENVDSLSNLYHNLNANRLNIKQIPFVIQFNKRDLPDAMPVGVMNRRLNFRNVAYFEAMANRSVGVLDTFVSVVKETVGATFRKYHLDKKIKDFDEMLHLIETNIRATMPEGPTETPVVAPTQESTVLRHNNVSVSDLAPGRVADPQELLENALKSNMETANLYSELKQAKDALQKKTDELGQLYGQLEKANQDNLKTRRYLEGLIQSVGEAIISFAADGRILTWNTAAEKIFGYSRAEIVGHGFHLLIPASRSSELDQAMAQVNAGALLRDLPTIRVRKGSEEFPCAVTYAPIRGSDESILAYSALVRDLTQQENLQRQLRHLTESTALAGIMPTVVNDLTNRFSSVSLQKALLLEALQGKPEADRVGRLLQSVDTAQNLLKPLLMLLVPSTPRMQGAAPNHLIQEAVKRVEQEAAASGVSVELALDPNLHTCSLDVDMFRESLVHLIRHSVQAASASHAKRVRIFTRQMAGSFQMACQDSGAPLPEATRDRIFDLGSARDADALGLAALAATVKAHSGRITLKCQEGSGNAFLMELPMTDAAPITTGAGLKGRSILVVDDETFLLECISEALSSWGSTTTSCQLAAEAIQKMQEHSYDLIVSDIRMPGLSGIQLFHWIQEHQPRMAKRILYTTGDSFDPETRAFLEESHLPHLGKPFDLKRLKLSLEDLLVGP